MASQSAGHAQTDVDLEKLREGFFRSFSTEAIAADITQAYGFVEGREQKDLRASMDRFHSDMVFDFGICRARERLGARHLVQYGDATSIQPYHIEFGNPFPGTRSGCAHHGVDVIYMFGAFNDALAEADNEVFKYYAESLADHGANAKVERPKSDMGPFLVNNLTLAKKFQDYVLGFIVGSPVLRAGEGEILVWGRDGSLEIQKLASPKWTERFGRLQLLEKDAPSILGVLSAI